MEAKDYPRKWYQETKHYYQPFDLSDRFEHIVLPILGKLERPTIDLIEFGSCFWDVAWLTARWTIEGFKYSENSVQHRDLSQYASRLSKRLRSLGRLSSKTKTILYRMPHLTAQELDGYLPATVIHQISSTAEAVVRGLSGQTKGKPAFAADQWDWESDVQDAKALGMDKRLRLDHSGSMLTGQHHFLGDNVHPNLLPNGKLWSDM